MKDLNRQELRPVLEAYYENMFKGHPSWIVAERVNWHLNTIEYYMKNGDKEKLKLIFDRYGILD